MQLSRHLKIGYTGVLSSLALLLSLFTFTGTASAHSVTTSNDDPHINVTFVERVNRVCVLAGIAGHGFGENNPVDDHADLFAFTDDGFASIFPHRVRLGEDGGVFTVAVICDQSFDERCFTNRFFAERCRFEHTGFVFARDEETGERSNIATFLFRFPFPF